MKTGITKQYDGNFPERNLVSNQEQGAQENVKGTTGCQLSNSELIRSLREWNSKLCNTGGSAWSLQVPVSLDKDPDILIEEICQRLVAMESYRTQSTEVKTQGPDNNHIKIAYFKRDLINWKESFAQDFPPSSIQFIRQISDLLNKYFASPSHPQVESAGVWVKASERISGHYVKVCCRRIEHPDHWFTAHWDYSKRIYVTYNDNNSWISKDEIEWLDEKK